MILTGKQHVHQKKRSTLLWSFQSEETNTHPGGDVDVPFSVYSAEAATARTDGYGIVLAAWRREAQDWRKACRAVRFEVIVAGKGCPRLWRRGRWGVGV